MQAVVKEKGWNGRIRDCDRRRYIFEKSDNSRAVKEYGQQGTGCEVVERPLHVHMYTNSATNPACMPQGLCIEWC